jgi:hypothetical protein
MLKFERTVNLTTSINNTTILDYAPLVLTINPATLDVSSKIYKIEYIFDDADNKTQKLFYKSSTTENLPFPSEIGDPRNYKTNKTFYFTSTAFSQTYGVSAYVYQMGVVNPTKIEFKLRLTKPKMDGKVAGAVFDAVELLYTRIFGVNNDILYVFETKDPCYYLSVVVNWNKKPIPENIINLQSTSKRAYTVLQPFQNRNYENPYTIDFVDRQKEADDDPNYPDCK